MCVLFACCVCVRLCVKLLNTNVRAAGDVLCELVCVFVFVFGGVCVWFVCVFCINTGVCFVCHLLCDAVSLKCLLGVCLCLCVLYKRVCCACHVCVVL